MERPEPGSPRGLPAWGGTGRRKIVGHKVARTDRLMADRPLEGRGAVLWRNGHPRRGLCATCSTNTHPLPFRLDCVLHEACDILGRDLDADGRPKRLEAQKPEVFIEVAEGR